MHNNGALFVAAHRSIFTLLTDVVCFTRVQTTLVGNCFARVVPEGATVATIVTFLPSFIFTLLGGTAVEATRYDVKFTAPLTGITAAVVGVAINLAVFFVWHVLLRP
jgi:hypothetical protein